MADEIKFQTIEETPIGELGKGALKQWQALVRRRKQLEAQEEKLRARFDKFFDELHKKMPAPEDVHATHGFRLGEDGVIYAVHCECPGCQAVVQGLSTTTVVEQMIRQGMLRGDDATKARRSAAEIDSQAAGEEDRKKRLLMN
jgi:hypothetical protein